MLSQVVTNQAGKHRENRHKVADTLTIREFLRMNPPSFTGSSVTEDPDNFVEELQKKNRVERAPPASWACFEEAFLGNFFSRELKEAKVREFLTLKQDSLSVHEFSLRFTQLSQYAPEMVADIRNRMTLFVIVLSRLLSEEDKPTYSQGSMAQRGSKPPACDKCGRNHSGTCRVGSTAYFKCGQNSHFMRECPKNKQDNGNRGNIAQSSSVAPPDRAALRRATSVTGGGSNRLYAITSRQEQEHSPDIVAGMIQVFNFNVYALLDPGAIYPL
ncbi:hypothetical protein R3W88_033498 [Solanum pinnatisectum]|uniref:Retrotransposon gag domain-containing protein n=1 Tax=Solanum pinnatisectum TaxID=50273 RepID=A0AAV9K134_9SOLN|nr:hypothetical protein R3W88_033498 [Solanum pinnatisectum]